jgi:hypothetical protein
MTLQSNTLATPLSVSADALEAMEARIAAAVAEEVARRLEERAASPWLDTAGVAAHLGVSVDAVKRFTRMGVLPVHKVGHLNRYHRDRVDECLISGGGAQVDVA